MPDEDLLMKLPATAEKPSPSVRRANFLSAAALVVSILSGLFAGSQWWEAHQTRKLFQKSQGPYIEVIKEEFVGQSSLMMTVHNIGHTTALDLRSSGEVYIGDAFRTGAEFEKVPSIYVMVMGAAMPNLPVGHDAQVGAYVPSKIMLEKSAIKYNDQRVMELRGRLRYTDDDGNLYDTPYCYQVHLPYGPSLPSASRCFHVFDKPPGEFGPLK